MENFPTQTPTSLTSRSALNSFKKKKKRVKSGGFEIRGSLATNPMEHQFHPKLLCILQFSYEAKNSVSLKPPHDAYSSLGPSKSCLQLPAQPSNPSIKENLVLRL